MGDKKIWSVTYTKHIKQKRKIYQDGFLHFHPPTNKLELYDDCQTLLGVKIAKTDDVIRSGEALMFSTYLVDIGDLEGNCKPVINSNGQVRANKVKETKPVLLHPRKKFSPVFSGFGKNRAPSCSLSPSQKIIKEFKKNEILKYGGSRNSSDATKASYTEWQVLYTTQKTQKAKKYHDGFLRIAACGSQGRQAKLYDLNRTVLDGKFLKKDEVVESGKSLIFDGHLVDVGELEGDHKPQSDLNVQGKNSYTGAKKELSQGQQTVNDRCSDNENLASSCSTPQFNGLTAVKFTRREWHALYTIQITQKAKKYYSGFLTLASSGSFQLQATLLAEDGTVLSRKFLKLSENVKSGSSFQVSSYLVEVGEPHEIPEGEPPKHSFVERDEKSTFSPSVESSEPKSYPVHKPLYGGEPPKNALSERKVKTMLCSGVGSEPRKCDPTDKSSSGEPPKVVLSGKELKSILLPIVDSSKQGKRDPVDKPLRGANDILSILRKSTTKQNSLPTKSISLEQHIRLQSSDSVHSQFQNHTERDVGDSFSERHGADSQTMGVINSENAEFRGESHSSPSIFTRREEVYEFSVLNSYGEHRSKSMLKPFSSDKEPQVKPEPQEPLSLDNGSNGNAEAFTQSMFPKDATSCLSYGLPSELDAKVLAQPGEEREMDTEQTSFEGYNNRSAMDDIPSFDLGF